MTFDTLLLECSKKRFHKCVVVAISFSTHAYFYFMLFQEILVALARILTSTIRIMQQTSSWSSPSKCHQCCLCNQLLISFFSHCPSDHKPRLFIAYCSNIEPPFKFFKPGNLPIPFAIR